MDIGLGNNPPSDYTKITVHFVYDIKHDGRYKDRMAAGGHLTGDPIVSVYSSVASLMGSRIVIFISELNNMKLWTTYV